LDYDYHFGDGTEDILRRLPNYQARVLHISSGARFHQQSDGEKFLQNIEFDLSAIIEFGADIVLYQAGADQHCKDPLGGMLNTDELKLRDRMVFTGLLSSGIGVSWNLAGGYQTPFENVLEIHENTAKEAIEVLSNNT
jgi:acetoin utilization deacetylase AcuC-like enzyme